jgi:DNA recombination protein RmuC
MQLRRTVEIAGLLDQCDFFEQVTEETDNGRLTPDMVVHLPGGRRIVVDAKAPEINLDNLEASTEEQRSQYLKTLAGKVRDHINQLSAKKYREQFEPTPEFVVMFLPGEALFTSALQHDLSLLEYGVSRKVMLASPLTLIALLHAVNYGWKQQSLAHDAAEIRDLGRDLHESVRILADHMIKMRDHLEGTVEAFNASIGSVERNFLSKARKLKELNAAGTEDIQPVDTIDERLRRFDAPELRQAASGGTPLFEAVIEKLTDPGESV